jgi:hypothetical protein
MKRQLEGIIVVAAHTRDKGDEPPPKRLKEYRAPLQGSGFDAVTLCVVPRFKDSPATDSQWRYSVVTTVRCKGRLVYETSCGDMKTAITRLTPMLDDVRFWDSQRAVDVTGLCDQPGCPELWTRTYQRKQDACLHCGHHTDLGDELSVRKFCERHALRGTQSFDDCDANYTDITAERLPPPTVRDEDKPGPYVPLDDSDSD